MYTIITNLSIEDAMSYTQVLATKQQWTIAHKDNKSISITKKTKSLVAFLILLIIWVLPGLLYLLFGGKKHSCAMYFSREKGQTTISIDAGIQQYILLTGLLSHIAKFDPQVKSNSIEQLKQWHKRLLIGTAVFFFVAFTSFLFVATR